MWVDAICINQEDPEERGMEVLQMADIYGKAGRVVIWLSVYSRALIMDPELVNSEIDTRAFLSPQ
jgi:hypothetical protein